MTGESCTFIKGQPEKAGRELPLTGFADILQDISPCIPALGETIETKISSVGFGIGQGDRAESVKKIEDSMAYQFG